eukprot:scaffold44005_cov69-Phaeocystis_antarctica.AAC.3
MSQSSLSFRPLHSYQRSCKRSAAAAAVLRARSRGRSQCKESAVASAQHLRAREAAQRLQGVRRQQHLCEHVRHRMAYKKCGGGSLALQVVSTAGIAQRVQGVRRQRHLRARAGAQCVQGVRGRQICVGTGHRMGIGAQQA